MDCSRKTPVGGTSATVGALLLYHGASLLCGEQNMRTVIVALLSGVVGSVLTYLIHRREIGVKMIEVAIGILRGEPDDNTKALRDWAVDVLAHYAKHHVPLSDKAKAELRSKPLVFVYEVNAADWSRSSLRGGGAVGEHGEIFQAPGPPTTDEPLATVS